MSCSKLNINELLKINITLHILQVYRKIDNNVNLVSFATSHTTTIPHGSSSSQHALANSIRTQHMSLNIGTEYLKYLLLLLTLY